MVVVKCSTEGGGGGVERATAMALVTVGRGDDMDNGQLAVTLAK